MAYGLVNPLGDYTTAASNNPFGLYLVDNSYDQPRTGATVTQDIVTQRQDIGGNADAWGGFWANAAGALLDYGIKRDAALVGAQIQAQQPKQPVYAPAVSAGAGGLTVSPMMLVLGAVVALVVLTK